MKKYQNSINYVSNLDLSWQILQGKTIMISGATGMIGSFLIEVLLREGSIGRILALGRNEKSFLKRFADYLDNNKLQFISHDVNLPLENIQKADYVVHAASNTHPVAYATAPIETIRTNVIGTNNMLEYATTCHAERFLFVSSVEVYGENKGDTEYFDENYLGYIDCNTLRAGYPESKRAGESLCQAYRKERSLDVVIARLARTYGPTMRSNDSKAISQFIKSGINKENIILKSAGNQLYSYCYVADAVSALLTILMNGEDGEAYNVADSESDICLKDLAVMIAKYSGTRVEYQLPDAVESAGYSKATKAIMSADKLKRLGWEAHWDISEGIRSTLEETSRG